MKNKLRLLAPSILLFASISVALIVAEVCVRVFVAVRLVGPSVTEYDPTYGHRHRAGVVGSQITPEFTWHFSFNSLGQRGPEPQAGSKSILFLGDSFTVGFGVNDGEEFPMIVGERLGRESDGTHINIVNAGLGNSGQGRWLKFLRSEAPALRPCLVVLQILDNDFSDNVREDLFKVSLDGTLQERPVAPRGSGRRAQELLQAVPWLTRTHLYGLFRQAYHGWRENTVVAVASAGAGPTAAFDAEELLTYQLLEEAATMIGSRGWPAVALVVGLPPTRSEKVLEILRSHSIPAESIGGRDEHPEWYYLVDGHWNRAGHQNAAALVRSMMDRRAELTCVF